MDTRGNPMQFAISLLFQLVLFLEGLFWLRLSVAVERIGLGFRHVLPVLMVKMEHWNAAS